jgi:predicted nucleic acid-binding protein
MKYVLDSSVAAKWELPEIDSDKARRIREEVCRGLHSTLAPDVYATEVAHALTRAERQGRIVVGEAARMWLSVMATPPAFARSQLLLPRAIAISSLHRVGVYDCLYVALAERRRATLVTADDRLVANLRPRFSFMVHLSEMPGGPGVSVAPTR